MEQQEWALETTVDDFLCERMGSERQNETLLLLLAICSIWSEVREQVAPSGKNIAEVSQSERCMADKLGGQAVVDRRAIEGYGYSPSMVPERRVAEGGV